MTWLCIFSVSEAEFGASCSVDDSTNCTATSESCIEGSCKCSNGYSYIDNECKSSRFIFTFILTLAYKQLHFERKRVCIVPDCDP